MKWHLEKKKNLISFSFIFSVSCSAQFTGVSATWTVCFRVKVLPPGAWWKTARSPTLNYVRLIFFFWTPPPQRNSKPLGFLHFSVASMMRPPLTASASKGKSSFAFWQQIHYFGWVWLEWGWPFVHEGINSRITAHSEASLRNEAVCELWAIIYFAKAEKMF